MSKIKILIISDQNVTFLQKVGKKKLGKKTNRIKRQIVAGQ